MKCQGKNHKGIDCKYQPLENDNYCKTHQSYKKMKELENANQRVCKNWIRGCWAILDGNYERCLDCRLKEREKEKNLRNKKKEKAITNNKDNKNLMCVTCNKIVLEIKNNKCEHCYLSAYNSNKNRNARDIFFAKLYEYKSCAKKRNIEFKLNDDKCFELFNNSCYYCSDFNEINGIDRIDSDKCYENENCVSCCKQCNHMKNDTDQNKFIKLCEHISTFNKLYNGKLYKDILINTKFGRYSQYKTSANKRNIKFEITKTFFIQTISKPCHYCGVTDTTYYKTEGAGGIDRIDSNNNYIESNCVPCCGMCNQMKLDYTNDNFLNKCVQIINNQKTENNKLKIETKLIDTFYKLQNVAKQKKKKFNHSKEYYENKIWDGNIDDLYKIKIKLIIVNNEELYDIWNYYKYYVSSLKLTGTSHLVGRQIYVIVADELTNKYLGIISLTSDYLNLSDRDDFIGWTKEQKLDEHKLNYILNISTCVPLQPFGFNFTGGKLLTKLVFSEEIQNVFKEKYNHPLLGITTTSLYGKSIQYDRLTEIKLIGYTKGNSVYKYPKEFVQECNKYLKDYYNISLNKKLYTISRVLQKLELPKDEFMSSNPKGIYFGFVYPDSKDYLCNKIDKIKDYKLKSINDIFNEWLNINAIKRYNNLLKTNRIQYFTKNNSTERTKKYLQKLKEKLGEEEYKKKKNESMKNYRNKKKLLIQDNLELVDTHTDHTTVVSTNDYDNVPSDHASTSTTPAIQSTKPKYTINPDLPDNFSLYKEKECWYLSFSKNINTIRHNKKHVMKCMCIQTELDRLIDEINESFPNLNIGKYTVKNPHDFTDKTQLKENNKPVLPRNFSIYNSAGKDYIQFSKKIDDKKVSYKIGIKSYDLQKELDTFVNYLNQEYKLNLADQKVVELNDWKTVNKIK
jgi:hypothetical protein